MAAMRRLLDASEAENVDTAALSTDSVLGAAVVVVGVGVSSVSEEPEASSLFDATSWVSRSRLLLVSPALLSLAEEEPATSSSREELPLASDTPVDEDPSSADPCLLEELLAEAEAEVEVEEVDATASSSAASAGDIVSVDVAVVTSTVVVEGVGVASEAALDPEADAEAVAEEDAEEQCCVTGSTRSAITPTPLTVQSPRSSPEMELSTWRHASLAHIAAMSSSEAAESDEKEYPESLEHVDALVLEISVVSFVWSHSAACDTTPASANANAAIAEKSFMIDGVGISEL